MHFNRTAIHSAAVGFPVQTGLSVLPEDVFSLSIITARTPVTLSHSRGPEAPRPPKASLPEITTLRDLFPEGFPP